MIAPFPAVGALIGRTIVGLAVGIIAVSLFWIVWSAT
jgi:hypothetical protein